MKTINWPTAAVCIAFVVAVAVLLGFGKTVPAGWLGMAGTIVAGFMQALLGGSSSGGGTLTSLPGGASKANGPVPPASTRGRLRLVPMLAAVFVLGILVSGCNGATPTPQTVTDVTIGLNAAVCVLTTYATDMNAGKGEVDAIADCVIKCGVSAAQATGLLDAHRKAETLEKAGKLPQASSDRERAQRALAILRRETVSAS